MREILRKNLKSVVASAIWLALILSLIVANIASPAAIAMIVIAAIGLTAFVYLLRP